MAPHFKGKHQSTVCSGCGFKIVSEVTTAPSNSVVCPNCGLRCETTKETATSKGANNLFSSQPADLLSIKLGELPERWQVIGFRRSNDDHASIKRVIGLPGEVVWFEHGNVFLKTKDGAAKLLKKNWSQQKATRILIHDNRFEDDDPRWLPLSLTSPLSTQVPAKFQTTEHHWINYRPKRCYDHPLDQAWSPQIEDSYGFNQNISRKLNRVNEVCLEFEFDPDSNWVQTGQAEWLVAIIVGPQTHLARFAFDRDWVEVQLFDGDNPVTAATRCRIDPAMPTCAVSNVDSQIIVAVGDQQIQLFDLDSPHVDAPVELLVSFDPANSENLKRMRLWRDIYYFSPLSTGELLRRQADTGLAGTEGYFVVGDNLPVSLDSRRWLLPRVAAEEILGVVDIGQ